MEYYIEKCKGQINPSQILKEIRMYSRSSSISTRKIDLTHLINRTNNFC